MDQANELGAQAPDSGAVDGTTDGAAFPVDVAPVDSDAGASVDTSRPQELRAPSVAFLTPDELRQVYEDVSLRDSWKATETARREYPDDPDMAKRWSGQLVFVYAAQRLGYADQGADPLDVLARIRQEDFIEVMQSAKGKSTAS